jgi:hypothetical protein
MLTWAVRMQLDVSAQLTRAVELLSTVRHATMATVNADGSPHNTPFFFLYSPDLRYIFWGSHPAALHSQNVARTGQIFVVLYDAVERGGLFIRADEARAVEGDELVEGKDPLPISYYQGDKPQRMYRAATQQFWTNGSERDEQGLLVRDVRFEIGREQLLA